MTSGMWTNMWSGVPIVVVLHRRGVPLVVSLVVSLIVVFIIVSLCNTAEANEHGYGSGQCECAFCTEL